MSDDKHSAKLEDIVSLCKRRGFIFPGSDVYGGLSGTWDYGPLGVQLKKNITNLWWKMFVDDAEDMLGVDAAILMNQKVWQASGHVDTFSDPLVECSNCHARHRADKLEDPNKCPTCGKEGTFGEPREFNMMFKTTAGPVNLDPQISFNKENKTAIIQEHNYRYEVKALGGEGQFEIQAKSHDEVAESTVYLRPETAQGIFTNFKNVVDAYYPDVPFGIAQQGKAFRNEISPRDFIFRTREFEQMEVEYFVHPDNWETSFELWLKRTHEWCRALGLPDESVHELEVPETDRAHYSRRTVDFEFDFPIGREELSGLAYRTDFDLKNIERVSGKSMEYRPKDGSPAFVPHVIEPSFGVERALMAVLTSGHLLDTGFEQIWLMTTSLNRSVADVFDTYVYQVGITQGGYSYATAVGLFKAVIGVLLIFGSNWLAKRLGERGLY